MQKAVFWPGRWMGSSFQSTGPGSLDSADAMLLSSSLLNLAKVPIDTNTAPCPSDRPWSRKLASSDGKCLASSASIGPRNCKKICNLQNSADIPCDSQNLMCCSFCMLHKCCLSQTSCATWSCQVTIEARNLSSNTAEPSHLQRYIAHMYSGWQRYKVNPQVWHQHRNAQSTQMHTAYKCAQHTNPHSTQTHKVHKCT